ncbi:TIGR04211 family SH3 domain-containing protein [Spongiibacter sp. KMU-158]|uniref:TIGR04211 family SH3 domain-containing protein n=1 Tax=Spongiibacter pelagi TaxID=2760804 RepID=A0A927GWN7_9GAMM|nr:TIGR04211 family SH3 domain-containing protein [Spongiibacter pelagi]MBD2859127.1 TIGR04211 family SH3 domain-containing protein [Spongiibacter pelagi]
MNRLTSWRYFYLALCLPLFPLAGSAQAQSSETRFITDQIHVPLRVGAGTKYRIVHRGLPSGTQLELIETDEDNGFSRVKTRSGLEGWLPSQYLSNQPGARNQLEAATAKLERLQTSNQQLREELGDTSQSNSENSALISSLKEENARLSEELEKIKRISANSLKLDSDNRRLLEQNQELTSEVDVLQTDNVRLRENQENEYFLNGAFAVIIGVLITLIVPRVMPKKRSDWA